MKLRKTNLAMDGRGFTRITQKLFAYPCASVCIRGQLKTWPIPGELIAISTTSGVRSLGPARLSVCATTLAVQLFLRPSLGLGHGFTRRGGAASFQRSAVSAQLGAG